MKKTVAIMLILILALSALSVSVAAAGESVSVQEPADTGDFFGMVIVMLLTSAMAVAALVAHRTRFVHDDSKKADG